MLTLRNDVVRDTVARMEPNLRYLNHSMCMLAYSIFFSAAAILFFTLESEASQHISDQSYLDFLRSCRVAAFVAIIAVFGCGMFESLIRNGDFATENESGNDRVGAS